MDIAVYSTKPADRRFLDAAAGDRHRLIYLDARLQPSTVGMMGRATVVCASSGDRIDATVIGELHRRGVRLVALRSAGFDNVDAAAASRLGIAVAHVPAYSPAAIAEYAIALMLALSRNIARAHGRVRENNFALDGLMGFNLEGRSVGIVGTGRIGARVAGILAGFGCDVLAYDPVIDAACAARGAVYGPLDDLLAGSDIVSLHCPLTPKTHHLIDAKAIARMRRGVMLINTSRGAVLDTRAAIEGLKTGAIGHLGLDVYEGEAGLFFEDRSGEILGDDIFARLLTFPNVLVTGHQGFFTVEAMRAIAETTIANVATFEATGHPLHAIPADPTADSG